MSRVGQLVLVVLVGLFLVSCSSQTDNEMAGKWKQVDGTQEIQFRKDGTVTVLNKGRSMEGMYKILDDSRVSLEIGDLEAGVNMIWEASVSSNELSFIAPSGKVLRFRKK